MLWDVKPCSLIDGNGRFGEPVIPIFRVEGGDIDDRLASRPITQRA